jgi:hypothetical protein
MMLADYARDLRIYLTGLLAPAKMPPLAIFNCAGYFSLLLR